VNPAEIICATAAAPAIETTVADLWREVLGYAGPIQPCDNFFALGGDSLAMMLFLFRAQEIFGVELPPAAMLEGPELLSVCGSLTAALAAASPQVPSGPAARSPTG
jgi:acyl carrier protein